MDARALIPALCACCAALAGAETQQLSDAVIADLRAAREALVAEEPQRALELLAAHAERTHPDVLALRAIALDRNGSGEAAIAAYEAALAANGSRQELALALISLQTRREDWEGVLRAAGTWLTAE